ncbi:uncharacterized protein PHACADRAFT_260217 [Phanerochaete carnosa HHB-10118-sp]|uniref:Uncharacterized protein n=1 Tax=Phanerochaete carnosa (strain HHB-10118-sp) TaxID=650164 RepID=K5UUN6_PHACS|nr:uncharacterized protein PHACADRAFT_260217 [Phanerochaete carnosa HHB-10118-sp]EKM53726.1 hypothetical protein PHACADRAFT_260217 [Phanerochaete carnosa HHB-10118-sp]
MLDSEKQTDDIREENPPDRERPGGQIVSEWREGKDMVIEIQRASGEDVEVVVVKNAYCPKAKQSSRALSPKSTELKRQDFIERCKHAVHHAEQAVKDSMHAGGCSRPVNSVDE